MDKKCAYCGKVVNVFDSEEKQQFFIDCGRPRKIGATQNYFDLWKRVYEFCPQCNYTHDNISSISKQAKEFLNSDEFNKICENKIFNEISEFRNNNILPYIIAGYTYEKEGNFFESSCAFANASDEFYGEIIYWEGETLEDGRLNEQDLNLSKKFHMFAEKLYDKSIELLDKYVSVNQNDINGNILYAGLLSGGNQKQKQLSKEVIKNLLALDLTNEQIDMIKFIEKTTY